MSIQSLLLVIAAAILHAAWNLITKKVNGKLPFFWLIAVASAIIYLPFVCWQLFQIKLAIDATVITFVTVSAILHLVYFVVLQAGYRKADLSVVYPIARGAGPFISVIGAMLLFNEKPSWLALVGILLIVIGVLVITGLQFSNNHTLKAGVIYGTLTGLFIAAYTLWDKVAVVNHHISALFITFASMLLPLLLLIPVAMKQKQEVKREVQQHWKQVIAVAIFQPLSFILVLVALKTTPVSYVAPARELSIVFGVFFGANLLKEADVKRRVTGASIMLIGIALLAIG